MLVRIKEDIKKIETMSVEPLFRLITFYTENGKVILDFSKESFKKLRNAIDELISRDIDVSDISLKREVKYGFKVVVLKRCYGLELDNKLISAISDSDTMEYEIGKRTWRKVFNGGLCVFDSLDNAINFYKKFHDSKTVKIYLCRYVEEPNKKYQNAFRLIRYPNHPYTKKANFPLPTGTKFARWVELITEVRVDKK